MTRQGINSILKSHADQAWQEKRIKQLEQLIPLQEATLKETDSSDYRYQGIKLRLDELRLEYKERVNKII